MNTALLIVAALGSAQLADAAAAADYATISQDILVNRPIEAVWPRISGFCQIGPWIGTSCAITSGTGEIGTVRRIGGRVDEVLVAKTERSYTYVLRDPALGLGSGTVEIRPAGTGKSRILYSVVYEAEPKAENRAAGRDRRAAIFAKALQAMKAEAER
jgi:hypothetical protein